MIYDFLVLAVSLLAVLLLGVALVRVRFNSSNS